MKIRLAICMTALAVGPLASGDVVEEEIWYNAEGKVVKKVTRTLTGAEAQKGRGADWEPAWVIRERARGSRRGVFHRSPYRYYRGRSYGRGYCYGAGYYYPRSYVRRGFSGFVRSGRGVTRVGVGFRSPGVGLFLNR